jgi:polyphosphate kinase 2 (PPK2 family)
LPVTLATNGYTVRDDDDDDPVLIHPTGNEVDTWRENYPYNFRMHRHQYEYEKRLLRIELLKLQKWSQRTGARHVALTDTEIAPWIVVKSNDKKRARVNAMRHVLGKFDYDDKDHEVVGEADPLIVGRALAD